MAKNTEKHRFSVFLPLLVVLPILAGHPDGALPSEPITPFLVKIGQKVDKISENQWFSLIQNSPFWSKFWISPLKTASFWTFCWGSSGWSKMATFGHKMAILAPKLAILVPKLANSDLSDPRVVKTSWVFGQNWWFSKVPKVAILANFWHFCAITLTESRHFGHHFWSKNWSKWPKKWSKSAILDTFRLIGSEGAYFLGGGGQFWQGSKGCSKVLKIGDFGTFERWLQHLLRRVGILDRNWPKMAENDRKVVIFWSKSGHFCSFLSYRTRGCLLSRGQLPKMPGTRKVPKVSKSAKFSTFLTTFWSIFSHFWSKLLKAPCLDKGFGQKVTVFWPFWPFFDPFRPLLSKSLSLWLDSS